MEKGKPNPYSKRKIKQIDTTTNLHGCLLLLFLHCTYFIYIKHACFVTLMKYILELLRTLFCENVCWLIR